MWNKAKLVASSLQMSNCLGTVVLLKRPRYHDENIFDETVNKVKKASETPEDHLRNPLSKAHVF